VRPLPADPPPTGRAARPGDKSGRRDRPLALALRPVPSPPPPYDPKQVAPLQPAALTAAREAGELAFASAADTEALATARAEHLGGRSALALASRELGALPPQAKADAGRRVNEVRAGLQAAYDARAGALAGAELDERLRSERVDVTLPTDRGRPAGARHPVTTIQERVADLFVAMGWEVAEGPEAEAEWFNFDALGLGPDHPARSEQDTFFVAPPGSGVVLRTQTSPVQVRSLLARPLPLYVACPGRVYRADTVDATHLQTFSQCEGIVVDEGITMAHLKGTLDAFASGMFGAGIVTRLRPSYFPFVEPGAEVDVQCFVCRGTGRLTHSRCPTCKGEGWIEWGGCGMVAPGVLRACGVVPVEDGGPWSGFAFGMGLERTLMQRHDIADIRDLVEGDVRFTAAFGMQD